jgi:hypothetical protein
VLAALVDAERAAQSRARPATPAREVPDHGAAEPVLEAAAGPRRPPNPERLPA